MKTFVGGSLKSAGLGDGSKCGGPAACWDCWFSFANTVSPSGPVIYYNAIAKPR